MFLTIAEVAVMLGGPGKPLSVRSVRRLTASGALPIVRVSPRSVRIPADAVQRHIEANTWQCEGSTVGGSASSSKQDDGYLSVCRSLLESQTPKRSKRSSVGRAGNVVPLVSRKNQA